MQDEVTLKLPLYDLECIADGMEVRLGTWRNTLRVAQGETVDSFDVEDSSNPDEVARMVDQYERLTKLLWSAINAHRAAE